MEVMSVVEPQEKTYVVRLTETEMNEIMIALGGLTGNSFNDASKSIFSYNTNKLKRFGMHSGLWNQLRSLLGHNEEGKND